MVLVGAFDFEKVFRSAIPIRGGHATNGAPVCLVYAVVRRIDDPVFGKDVLHDPDDDPALADFDGLMFGAFQGDGGLSNARRGDCEGWGRG